MTRMTKEFSLVLLGSGLLTAGYFLAPEEDLEFHGQEAARNQVGGSRHGTFFHPIFIHTGRFGSTGSTATASISRGGFGNTGHIASGLS